jgi:predicted phosphodiesterase
MLMPTKVMLGPHEAEVSLTFDSLATFDLGPLGKGYLPLDEPANAGARVVLKGVPIGPEASGRPELTSDDLTAYAPLLSNVDRDVAIAKSRLLRHALKYGAVAAGLALVGSIGLYQLLGKRRREELARSATDMFSSRSLRAIIAAAILSSTATASVPTTSPAHIARMPDEALPVQVLQDTPLEGMHVTGKYLAAALTEGAPLVLDALHENERFYDNVIAHLRTAFEQNPVLRPTDLQHMIVFSSDSHCNVGMDRVIGELARLSHATLMVDGGDITMSGTDWEAPCVSALGAALPKIKRVAVGGNHDSPITEKQLKANDYTVLDGKTIIIDGLKILGDDDPMRSMIGVPIYQEGKEALADTAHRLADAACKDHPNLLLVHTPSVAEEAIARGCIDFALSGHTHSQAITTKISADGRRILHLTADNASGAVGDAITVGPLQSTTSLYIMKASKRTGELSYYQVVSFHPDASVTISQPTYVPPPMPPNSSNK